MDESKLSVSFYIRYFVNFYNIICKLVDTIL